MQPAYIEHAMQKYSVEAKPMNLLIERDFLHKSHARCQLTIGLTKKTVL